MVTERKIKNTSPNFKIKLTEEQKLAKEQQLDHRVTIFTGKQGTSKTFLQCNVQFTLLLKNQVDKIILTRPMVEQGGQKFGQLPGDVGDKMGPYIDPILDLFYELRSKDEIDEMVKKEKIQVIALQHFRGRNIKDAVLIVDEQANVTAEDLKLICSRLCSNAKIILTLDEKQIDLVDRSKSAAWFVDCIKGLDGVSVVELKENFRDPLAIQICDAVEKRQKELKQI